MSKVQAFIKAHQLFDSSARLLVAVSGGVDSVVLLHLLHSVGYQCVAAHCNFHLRGEESDGDERFVEAFTSGLGVPLHRVSFDTRGYAKEHHLSIEMAARQLRYEWFEKVRQETQCDWVVVAHHASDVIETFFLNLARGTGVKGLTGIPCKNGFVVRPLLGCTREEIEGYATLHGLEFRTDSTNGDTSIKRNAIRHLIVPQMRKLNPSFERTMMENISHITNIYNLYLSNIYSYLNNLIINDGDLVKIDVNKLLQIPFYEVVLGEILLKYGFNGSQIRSVGKVLQGRAGRLFVSKGYRLVKDRNFLVIVPLGQRDEGEYVVEAGVQEVEEPLHLRFEVMAPGIIDRSADVATLDADKVAFPLRLRRWKRGDFFYPFGLKGRKKLSDFFTDRKCSLVEKERCWVMCDASDAIVWVVGMRIDGRFAVSEETRRVLVVKCVD